MASRRGRLQSREAKSSIGSNLPGAFDVFLSHAHTDSEFVELLGTWLEDEAQLRVWLDRWVLIPGEHWQQEMAKGLDQAKSCVVCIGQHTPKGWFREEIERAINRQTKDRSFRVIPAILPDGDTSLVDDFLELRTWVQLRDGIGDRYALHVLVCGIKGKPPGRNPYQKAAGNADTDLVVSKLKRLKWLHDENLINDEVTIEYQRRLLDKFFG